MITIDKKITIDEGDVPVFLRVCQIAKDHLDIPFGKRYVCRRERQGEIEKFLRIIFDKV